MNTIQIAAPAGVLELRAVWQPSDDVALICHPHPLFGGTMDNKVVTTLARFFRQQQCSVISFNFRGVGLSSGNYDQGRGEIEDALTVLHWISQQSEARRLYLAGFSFGAYIAAAVAAQFKAQELPVALDSFDLQKVYLVAPAVENFPMHNLALAANTLVIVGDQDEVVSPQHMLAWAQQRGLATHVVAGASHFFHGYLPALGQLLAAHYP